MKLTPTKCALCGSDASTQLYPANFSQKDLTARTFSARRTPDRIHYRLVRCTTCGLVYSNPILPSYVLAKLYKESRITYEGQVKDLCQTYGNYFFRSFVLSSHNHLGGGRMDSSEVKISRHSSTVRGVASQHLGRASPKAMPAARGVLTEKRKTSPRVLEIGCGNGFFLEYLVKQGWTDVWGVEPSREAVAKAPRSIRRRIKNSIFRPNLFPKNFFDYISTFQTLDHVTDPNTFLRTCWKILKPGGKLLAINHDVSSWSAKLLGENSPIIDIEHIYLFDKQTLAAIFAKNGFAVEKVFTVIDQHRLGYWLRMAPIPLFKRKLIRVMDRLKLSRIPVVIPAGNIGIIVSKTAISP